MTDIRFGTDGWRALITEEFTFENVARCALGLSAHLKESGAADRNPTKRNGFKFNPGLALDTTSLSGRRREDQTS